MSLGGTVQALGSVLSIGNNSIGTHRSRARDCARCTWLHSGSALIHEKTWLSLEISLTDKITDQIGSAAGRLLAKSVRHESPLCPAPVTASPWRCGCATHSVISGAKFNLSVTSSKQNVLSRVRSCQGPFSYASSQETQKGCLCCGRGGLPS